MEQKWHSIKSEEMYNREVRFNKTELTEYLVTAVQEGKECLTLSSYAQVAMERGIYIWREEKDEQKVLDYFRLAHLARTWHWKGLYDDGPHEVILPGEMPIHCNRMRPNLSVKLDTWQTGWEFAVLFRDSAAMEVYNTVPHANLRERLGVRLGDYFILKIEMLKKITQDKQAALAACQKAIASVTDPEKVSKGHFPFAQLHQLPLLRTWEALLTGDEAAFNHWMEVGLINYAGIFERDPPSSNFLWSFLDTTYLAACCYAHDHGINITVKSDYIPEFLIFGEFPKLKWPNPEWIK